MSDAQVPQYPQLQSTGTEPHQPGISAAPQELQMDAAWQFLQPNSGWLDSVQAASLPGPYDTPQSHTAGCISPNVACQETQAPTETPSHSPEASRSPCSAAQELSQEEIDALLDFIGQGSLPELGPGLEDYDIQDLFDELDKVMPSSCSV